MNATTVAVDLAKSVFQLVVAHDDWKPVESHRLTRRQFEAFFNNRAFSLVIMEACGSAHHWARWLGARGIEVRLLPAAYVRADVRRNKTDAADAHALLEACVAPLEKELSQLARQSAACIRLLTIPGIGLLTATAMVAATGGSVSHFRDARHFASGFGLTPREHSSGSTRKLGRISKQGDKYLRMLLTHGARACLRGAALAAKADRSLDALRQWAVNIQSRTHHNKAACALANKLARICYSVLRDATAYGEPQPWLARKADRTSFAVAA